VRCRARDRPQNAVEARLGVLPDFRDRAGASNESAVPNGDLQFVIQNQQVGSRRLNACDQGPRDPVHGLAQRQSAADRDGGSSRLRGREPRQSSRRPANLPHSRKSS